MSIEENKKIVRRFFEDGLNAGNEQAIWEQICDEENYILYDQDGDTVEGIEESKQGLAWMRNTFPDINFKIHTLVAEGDMVVAHTTMSGTHQGEFLGISPTDKRVGIWAMNIFRIVDGRFVEI